MFDLALLLAHLADVGGSDLHVKAGSPPRVRVNGELRPAPFPTLKAAEIEEALRTVMSADRWEEFERTGEADFSVSVPDLGRFRGNAYRQRSSVAVVLRRVLPFAISVLDLGLPPIVTRLADEQRGLVLVTGPTGSGKTTTLAAMVDHINQTRAGSSSPSRTRSRSSIRTSARSSPSARSAPTRATTPRPCGGSCARTPTSS